MHVFLYVVVRMGRGIFFVTVHFHGEMTPLDSAFYGRFDFIMYMWNVQPV
jgi:hypothetical protein